MYLPTSTLVYCLLFLFVTHLSILPISASVIRECYEKEPGPPCSKGERAAIDCIQNKINGSLDQMDVTVKITTKVSAWKSTNAKFCAEWPEIKDKVKPCDNDPIPCTISEKSSNICGHNASRCSYLKYANCGIKSGMIKGKFMHGLQSQLCIETDLDRGLIPYYGPHLKCYDTSRKNSGDDRFPLDHYLQFCQNFNHGELEKCIEAELAPVTSDELGTDKGQFIRNAKRFLHETEDFCEAFSKIDVSILTKCRMKNVYKCSEEAFNRARTGTDPPWGYFIPCISEQYAECHAPIGDIINGSFRSETNGALPGFTALSPSYLIQILIFFFVYLHC